MSNLLFGSLAFRLAAAYRRVDRYANRALSALDLTHAHGHVLWSVLEQGELRIKDIAKHTGFEESTTSRLVKELARRKLLRRRRHPDDGRSLLFSAGVRANALRLELEHELRRVNERLTRELPNADLEGFLNTASLLDRLS